MLNLGIEYEELVKAEIEDFYDKEVSDEVVQMRFSYFNRKQEELVRQIKQYAKESLLKELDRKKKENFSASEKEKKPSGLDNTDFNAELEKVREKHKKKIKLTKINIQDSFRELNAINEKLQTVEAMKEINKSKLLEKREKMQRFKDKQLENLENLRNTERKKPYQYRINYSSTPSKSIMRKKILEYSEEGSICDSDDDIQVKIDQYEDKINKSRALYDKALDSRRKAAQKLILKAELASKLVQNKKQLNEEELLSKLLMKRKAAEDRRMHIIQSKMESRLKQRQQNLEKMDRAASKLREQESLNITKANAIERRMEICRQILEQKNLNWAKELEIRNEFQKLKDEEALNNAERKRRIMYEIFRKYKRDLVIEKQIIDTARIKQLQDEKCSEITRKFDIAIKSMIEKEKYYKVIANLNKSPQASNKALSNK